MSLTFFYGTMNSGKTTRLIQTAFAERHNGLNPLVLRPRCIEQEINTRAGLTWKSTSFGYSDDLYKLVYKKHNTERITLVLIDEAQFLQKHHVRQLIDISHKLSIEIETYGLKTNYKGELFEGSKELFIYADTLSKLSTRCSCGRGATFNIRYAKGERCYDGLLLDSEKGKYKSVCTHFFCHNRCL